MNTTLFAIGMQKHVIFVICAVLFFIIQFVRTRRWYQLVMATAFAVSLLIYAAPENNTLFYGVGIAEAVLLLTALVMNIVQSSRINRAEKAKKAAEEAGKDSAPTDPPAAPTEPTEA